ncbi:hypothetical protein C1646_683648 [Rhizophagus diaphanus]|nr:hypothetical protein C1646_683648 [Rhizophagus diaphanus] [Rhizophagus sp. MUCL 43196]
MVFQYGCGSIRIYKCLYIRYIYIGWDKTIHNIHISIIINESITKTNHIYIYIYKDDHIKILRLYI